MVSATETRTIKVSDIKGYAVDSPRPVDMDMARAIGLSIQAEGQMQPIGVMASPDPGGPYRIIWGGHRVAGCKAAGVTDIMATIYPSGMTPSIYSMLMWCENLTRQDLTLEQRRDHQGSVAAAIGQQHLFAPPVKGRGRRQPNLFKMWYERVGLKAAAATDIAKAYFAYAGVTDSKPAKLSPQNLVDMGIWLRTCPNVADLCRQADAAAWPEPAVEPGTGGAVQGQDIPEVDATVEDGAVTESDIDDGDIDRLLGIDTPAAEAAVADGGDMGIRAGITQESDQEAATEPETQPRQEVEAEPARPVDIPSAAAAIEQAVYRLANSRAASQIPDMDLRQAAIANAMLTWLNDARDILDGPLPGLKPEPLKQLSH